VGSDQNRGQSLRYRGVMLAQPIESVLPEAGGSAVSDQDYLGAMVALFLKTCLPKITSSVVSDQIYR